MSLEGRLNNAYMTSEDCHINSLAKAKICFVI